MVNATLEDLKLESGYMIVRGKGDKERIVPLGKPAQDALAEYLAQGRAVLAEGRASKNSQFSQKMREIGHPSDSNSDRSRSLPFTNGNFRFSLLRGAAVN